MATFTEETLARYEALVATLPGIPRKGAKSPYTSLNGNMFTFIGANGNVSLRLPEDERAKVTAKHGGTPSLQHGAVMREYVEIPPETLAKPRVAKRLFAASLAYAQTLPAKPTKKPTKKPR